MVKEIFYQSSLPRAGSTLLQNLMHQNPDIYSTPTDGVLELVFAARANYTNSAEFKAQDAETMAKGFKQFCHDGMYGFYNAVTDRPYVLSKSRGWGIHYGFLSQFMPEPKILVMVRDLRDVFASMEKNFRKSQLQDNPVLNWEKMQGTTTPRRIDVWAQSQPVGLAIDRLNEILRQGLDKHMLFIRYEDLCMYPEAQLVRIYDYLKLPHFQHDVDNIQQFTVEDDEVYGVFGDHKIRHKLEYKPSDAKSVLGKDVSDWIWNNYKWFFDQFRYTK